MEARLSAVFKSEEDYKILQKFKGKTLENKGYMPLFDYFKHFKEKKAFRVLCDTYVTEDSGTGCVHQVIIRSQNHHTSCRVILHHLLLIIHSSAISYIHFRHRTLEKTIIGFVKHMV